VLGKKVHNLAQDSQFYAFRDGVDGVAVKDEENGNSDTYGVQDVGL
jgi:hypothetical protein